MSAWPTDERIAERRRPRPSRWLVVALVSFVAIFMVVGLGPELEEDEELAAPWAVPFVLAMAGTLVGLVGAVVSAIRARRFRTEEPSEEEGATRAGRRGLYIALGGLGIIIVTMVLREVLLAPAPEDDLGPVEGTFATAGVCVMILGLSYWGIARGRLAAEHRMVRNLEGSDRIEPTNEEEAVLQRVFARLAAQSHRGAAVYWATAAGNPTDVREADRTIPLDRAAARAICRDAFDAEGAEILEDGEVLQRGWWFMGGVNGNPVLVTLAFEADGLGGTHVTARSAVKFYLTNQDLAQEALDRMLGALDLDAREHLTSWP